MARKPKATPGVGHNSDQLADESTFRRGLAMYVLMDEEKKKQRERHKRLTKRCIEGEGIAVADIKTMFEMKDDSLPEIVHWIRRKMHALGSMMGVKFQIDFFRPDPEHSEAIKFKGFLSGAAGESCSPPTTLTNEERNLYIEGHGLGADSRREAEKEMSKEFTEGQDGDYSSEALTARAKNKAKAKSVGLQAAKDFEADEAGAPTDEESNVVPLSQSAKAEAARQEAGV